jgi:hypothetical protein
MNHVKNNLSIYKNHVKHVDQLVFLFLWGNVNIKLLLLLKNSIREKINNCTD